LYARNLRHPKPTSIQTGLLRLADHLAACLKTAFSGSTS
jgi:hypothetical protein